MSKLPPLLRSVIPAVLLFVLLLTLGWWQVSVVDSVLLLLVALLFWGLYLLLRQPFLLRQRIEARTEELRALNAQLQAEVAERRRIEASLRREKGFTDAIMNSAPGLIGLLDSDGRLLRWNAEVERLGHPVADLLGMPAHKFVPAFERRDALAALAEVRTTGATTRTFTVCSSDTETIPHLLTAQRVLIEDSLYIAVVGIDIRERIALERRLEREKDFFKAAIDALPGMFFLYDTRGRILRWNRNVEEVTGYRPEELAQMVPSDFPLIDTEFFAQRQRGKEGMMGLSGLSLHRLIDAPQADDNDNRPVALELLVVTKDGRSLPYLFNTVAVRMQEDAYLMSVALDLTQRKEDEQRLCLLESAVSNARDAILITVAGETLEASPIVYVNPAFCRLSGYRPEEVMGQPPRVLYGEAADESLATAFKRLEQETSVRAELPQRRKDGSSYWVELSLALIEDGQGALTHFVAIMRDISERKDFEARLYEQNRTLQSFYDSAAVMMGILELRDDDLIHVFDNRMTEIFFGTSAAELQTKSLRQRRSDPDYIEMWLNALRTSLQQQRAYSFEYRHPLQDEAKWLRVTINYIGTGSGSAPRFAYVITDLSERKRLEQEWQTFSLLVESSSDFISMSTPLGQTLFVNRAGRQLVGLSNAEAVAGTIIQDYVTAATYSLFEREAAAALLQGAWQSECQLRHFVTGEAIDVQLTAFMVIDPDGEAIGVAAIARDIHEQKRTEAALRESEFRWQFALEGARDGLWDYHLETGDIFYSRQWKALLGFEEDEISDSVYEWRSRVHPDDLALCLMDLARHFRGESEFYQNEHRILCKDGQYRWMLDRGKVMHHREDGTPLRVIGTFTDIHSLKEAKDAAESANRAKSEFLSRMSHELRTPLNAILGFSQIMAMDALEPRQKRAIDHILKAGRQLLDLINEVLDIARIEAGKMALSLEGVPLEETLGEVLGLIAPMADVQEVRLHDVVWEETGVSVQADRQRLKQVLLNLLANAVKYNRRGGEVRLRVRTSGQTLRLEVEDSGYGIASEGLERLFRPFERLEAESSGIEGSGLGLALSERLVTAMGGTIGVTSQPGEGSVFWLELPRAANALPLPPVPEGEEEGGGQTLTLLYIEDNLSNIELVSYILARRPQVRLLSAMQGTLGLDLALQHLPDLIVLDLHLPDLDGFAVLSRLKADPRTAAIPVIMLTADAVPGKRESLLAAGAAGCLSKPIDVKRFLATLDNLGVTLDAGNA